MKQNFPVGVLVLGESKEAAEALVNSLRRSGLSLRPRWVNRPGMLAEFLRGQPWDLLLAGLEPAVVPPAQVVEVVRRSDRDVALIGVIDGSNGNASEDALRAGFHDVVPNEPAFLLEHAVSRELESLDQRRRVRRLKAGLQASTRTLRELIHKSERAVAFVHGGQILQANPVWMELMAMPPGEDLRGRPLSNYVAEEDREAFSSLLAEQGQAPNPLVEIELSGLRANGERIPLVLDIVPATFEERAGFLVAARDPQSATPAESSTVDRESVHDGRHVLIHAIDTTRGAIACILIENQAKLDEVLGLIARERVAEEVLKRIRDRATAEAVVARISDDTYGVHLPGVDRVMMHEHARSIADAITHDVIKVDGHTVRPVCLTGVAAISEKNVSGMDVLEAAYDACRRPITVEADQKSTDSELISGDEGLAEDLVTGMSDGRLTLIFQPIVRLHGEPIELYEVFIRLKDRQGTVVPTRAVVSAAQRADLSEDLDLWVIQRATEILETTRKQGRDTHLFVKLSDQCMENIKIPLTITRQLKTRNVPPENLIIELSEVAASGNLKRSQAFVESLGRIRCPAALDHFGLSLSAFQLLEDVPAVYLKLDASLINRLADDAEAFAQVKEICRRAAELNKHTIASYLDNPRSLPKLYEAGVEFAQGYYIQEPGETMDFEFSILVE